MKIKTSILVLLMVLSCFVLASCGKKTEEPKTEKTEEKTKEKTEAKEFEELPGEAPNQELVIWVGSESVEFYKTAMEEYNDVFKAKYGVDFPGTINVVGVDTGSAADTYLVDLEAGADIFTVAHDNLGKLMYSNSIAPTKIAPIKSETLIAQIEANNPIAFIDACFLQGADGSAAQYYAAPIYSQTLVLYYNKAVFAGQEDKLASWEGIMEVAAANNAMATAFPGTDGYNYSAFLLAQPYSVDAKKAFGTQGTLQIYKDGIQANCMGYGDDQVAIHKWAQRFINDPNGRNGEITSSYGWEKDLKAGKAITFIGGSWHVNGVSQALGKDNYGVVELPTFTLTEEDAYGKAQAGMTFHSGSFVDAKCLVKKVDSAWESYLDDIIEYLTSNKNQERSCKECGNQPASLNVDLEGYELAQAQLAQASYGIAQPFGFKEKFNTYYYSKGAPDLYVAIHQNADGAYASDAAILAKLQEASFIWAKGRNPETAQELADWVASK